MCETADGMSYFEGKPCSIFPAKTKIRSKVHMKGEECSLHIAIASCVDLISCLTFGWQKN